MSSFVLGDVVKDRDIDNRTRNLYKYPQSDGKGKVHTNELRNSKR